jgi:lysophospholipase L1-like esterase
MRPLAVALLCALIGGGAFAKDTEGCITAAGGVAPDFAMPRVAEAIAKKRLDVVVIGSASSELAGPSGSNIAYPTRFEAALAKLLPGVAVKVRTFARPRETAEEMENKLSKIVAEAKPALVVWQTGTADAIRGVDPDDFRIALDDGIDTIQQAGADIAFMNMQYSPRTDSMIALGSYVDAMRFVALQREVLLFDRLAVMKHWNEMGVFDLYTATKKTDTAEKVHDCIGRLLGRLIVDGAKLAQTGDTVSGSPGGTLNKDLH